MTEKKLTVFIIILGISMVFLGIWMNKNHPAPKEYYYDLPEEIMAADSTDTMDAVLKGRTIFITFRNQHK